VDMERLEGEMGEAYGWTDNGRQVFAPKDLEDAAADLRSQNSAQQLTEKLLGALAPDEAFGKIPGGRDASARLRTVYESMKAELDKVGIDLSDLASRTLAAAKMAHDVDPATQAAARRVAHGIGGSDRSW
jgi:hypothetical protein